MAEQDKPRLSWNPFQKIESEETALEAAKAGVAVAALIAVGYVIFMALKVFANQDPYGDSDAGSIVVVDSIAIALASFLGWRVHRAQATWASVLLLIWVIAETVGKVVLVSTPGSSVSGASFIVNIIGVIAGILSVRGCLRLASMRKDQAISAKSGTETSPAELIFWQSIKDSSDPAEFDAYEQRFPNGAFISLARARAAKLRSVPDGAV